MDAQAVLGRYHKRENSFTRTLAKLPTVPHLRAPQRTLVIDMASLKPVSGVFVSPGRTGEIALNVHRAG